MNNNLFENWLAKFQAITELPYLITAEFHRRKHKGELKYAEFLDDLEKEDLFIVTETAILEHLYGIEIQNIQEHINLPQYVMAMVNQLGCAVHNPKYTNYSPERASLLAENFQKNMDLFKKRTERKRGYQVV